MRPNSGRKAGARRNVLHENNTGGVQLVDDFLRRDTDGAYEQLGAALDDDIRQLGELSVRVVILRKQRSVPGRR